MADWVDGYYENKKLLEDTLDITGGGGGAPTDGEYIVSSASAQLSAERVLTDSTTITKNVATPGEASFERAALTGDVTADANSNTLTIATSAVTNAKQSDMAANTIKVNATASAAAPQDLAIATSKIVGRGPTGNVDDLGLDATLSISNTEIGRAALTGDVGVPAGSNTATIAGDAVTNAKMANMAADTIKVNNAASSGDPVDLGISAGSIVGRGPTGHIASLTVGSGLTITDTGISATAVSGESNTASNKNVGGVGVFKQKTGVDLEFRGINAGSSKVTVTLDSTNNEIDLDIAEGNLAIGSRYRPSIAALPYVFSTGVAPNDPTATKFKFDSATLASITKMWIDPLDANSIDTTFDLLQVQSGDVGVVMNAAQTSIFTTFTFSSTATDKTGYYEFTGTASAGTLPTNNEAVVIVYVSKSAKRGILAADNFARFQDDGDGGYNLIDWNDDVVNGIVPTYALASNPVSGITELPTINDTNFRHGMEIRIHQDCFIGDGHNPLGAYYKTDTVNGRLIPSNNAQLLFSSMGTIAAPLASLSAPGRFDIANDPHIPGGLLTAGSQLRLVMFFRKKGTVTSPLAQGQIRLGTDLVEANYANNSIAYSLGNISSADNFDLNSDSLVTFQTTTTATTNRNATRGGGGTASLWSAISTLLDTTDDMAVSFTMSILTSPDTADLIGYQIWHVG